ncbi:TPA: hypothetical protein ACYU6Z_004244, partial [Klebsiella quasipneumoniae subsp. quasipneumoniae]
KSLLNEQAFLHLWPVRMRTSGGRRFDLCSVGPRKRSAAGHHQCATGQKPHQNHKKRLYPHFQPAVRYFVTSSIAFFYR